MGENYKTIILICPLHVFRQKKVFKFCSEVQGASASRRQLWQPAFHGPYGLYLGPEITHSLETASSETTNFEFDRSGGTGASTAQRVNCHGIRPSGIIHMPDASGPMALQPSDSHSGCCTSSIWGPEPHQNPRKQVLANFPPSPPL